MKIVLTLLIILHLIFIPFIPFSQNKVTNASIASVEYLDKQLPIKQKVKKKKRPRKYFKQQFKQKKKQHIHRNRKKIATNFIIIASILFVIFLVWAIYFFPLLASGSLFTGIGLAALGGLIFAFLGIFLSLILLTGAIIFLIFAIKILNRENKKTTKEEDYIKTQIKDKAARTFPDLPPETLEEYIDIKQYIVELKYDRNKLEVKKDNHPLKSKVQEEIDNLDEKIITEEAVVGAIEKIHADLGQIPDNKRLPYTNIKLKLFELQQQQEKYQQQDNLDLRSIKKLKDLEKAIQKQEGELKLLFDN